jgi:hypothetical protein
MISQKILHRIVLILFLAYSGVAFSQSSVLNKNITLQLSDKPLGVVLKIIEKKAGVNFVYVSGLFNPNLSVSISVKNTSLKAVLLQLFPSKKHIDFYVSGQNIILTHNTTNERFQEKKKDITTLETIPLEIKHDTVQVIVKDTVNILKHDTVFKLPTVEVKAVKVESTTSYSLGAFSVYTFPTQFISIGTASTNVFNLAKASEQTISSVSAGMSFDYKNGNFGFQTGLGVSTKSWSAQYNYQTVYTDYSTITGYTDIQSWMVRPHLPGEPLRREDSTLVITKTPIYKTQNVNVNYKNVNMASYVYIPLQFNYYYPLSQTFSLQAGIGVDISLLYAAQGQTLVADNAGLSDLKTYLSDYILFGKAMLGANYSFTPRHSVSFQVGFGYDLTPVFRTNYPIQRYEYIPFLGVAYRWWF